MAPGVMEATVTVGGQAGGRGLLLRKFAIRYPLGSGWLMLGWRGVGIEGGRGGRRDRPDRPISSFRHTLALGGSRHRRVRRGKSRIKGNKHGRGWMFPTRFGGEKQKMNELKFSTSSLSSPRLLHHRCRVVAPAAPDPSRFRITGTCDKRRARPKLRAESP